MPISVGRSVEISATNGALHLDSLVSSLDVQSKIAWRAEGFTALVALMSLFMVNRFDVHF